MQRSIGKLPSLQQRPRHIYQMCMRLGIGSTHGGRIPKFSEHPTSHAENYRAYNSVRDKFAQWSRGTGKQVRDDRIRALRTFPSDRAAVAWGKSICARTTFYSMSASRPPLDFRGKKESSHTGTCPCGRRVTFARHLQEHSPIQVLAVVGGVAQPNPRQSKHISISLLESLEDTWLIKLPSCTPFLADPQLRATSLVSSPPMHPMTRHA